MAAEYRGIALLIGNSNYDNLENVENAGNDVSVMSRKLGTCGYDIILAVNNEIAEIVGKVLELKERLAKFHYLEILIYYAGHGIVYNEEHYIVGRQFNENAEVYSDEVALKCLSVDRDIIQSICIVHLDEKKTRSLVVILDACRSKSDPSERGSTLPGGRLLDPLIPSHQARIGILVGYACALGRGARDSGDHGLYTGCILENVFEPGRSVLDALSNANRLAASRTNTGQTPFLYVNYPDYFHYPLLEIPDSLETFKSLIVKLKAENEVFLAEKSCKIADNELALVEYSRKLAENEVVLAEKSREISELQQTVTEKEKLASESKRTWKKVYILCLLILWMVLAGIFGYYEFSELAVRNAEVIAKNTELEDKMRYLVTESNQCILENDATTKQLLQALSLQKSKIIALKAELDRRDMESTTNGRDMESATNGRDMESTMFKKGAETAEPREIDGILKNQFEENPKGKSYAMYIAFYLLVANASISACAYFLDLDDLPWKKIFFFPLFYLSAILLPLFCLDISKAGSEAKICIAIVLLLLGDFLVYYFCGLLVFVLVLCFCSAFASCILEGKSLTNYEIFINIAAFFSPPLVMFLKKGFSKDFMINCLLTLGYFPGVYHARMFI